MNSAHGENNHKLTRAIRQSLGEVHEEKIGGQGSSLQGMLWMQEGQRFKWKLYKFLDQGSRKTLGNPWEQRKSWDIFSMSRSGLMQSIVCLLSVIKTLPGAQEMLWVCPTDCPWHQHDIDMDRTSSMAMPTGCWPCVLQAELMRHRLLYPITHPQAVIR